VRGANGVEGTFLGLLLARAKAVGSNAQLAIPANAHFAPVLVPLHRFVRVAEELDLHLLEFPTTKRVVARIDLIAERLAHLRDAERELQACAVEHILEV